MRAADYAQALFVGLFGKFEHFAGLNRVDARRLFEERVFTRRHDFFEVRGAEHGRARVDYDVDVGRQNFVDAIQTDETLYLRHVQNALRAVAELFNVLLHAVESLLRLVRKKVGNRHDFYVLVGGNHVA